MAPHTYYWSWCSGAGLRSCTTQSRLGCTIYEAYSESAGLSQGIFLTLAVNGVNALRAISADDLVNTLGFPTGKMHFYSESSGKKLGEMDMGPVLDDGTRTTTLKRTDLYHALHNAALEVGINIEHNKRLVNAKESETAITAIFEDGSTASGTVLIGADGLRSSTRKLIDLVDVKPQYTGMGNCGGFVSNTELSTKLGKSGEYHMIWGKHCFFGYTISQDGEVWWFANPPASRYAHK